MNTTTEHRPHGAGTQSDEVLLRRAREGDSKALAVIYEQTCPEVYRTIRSMVRSEDDAMDILQDTYLKAFTRLDQLQSGASLRPWLRQAAANTARDFLRRKKPSLFSELEKEDDGPVLDFEDDRAEALPELVLDRKETQRLVREMLDELSEEQRLVIGMYYYRELSVKEIADQLGVSQNTVKSQLRYGRQKIEKRVRVLEKQGVKLCGLSPILFFRTLLKQGLESTAVPAKLGAATRQISAQGVRALEPAANGMRIKTVTTKGLLLKRVLIGAGALAAAGGISVGAGALLSRNRDMGNVRPPEIREEQIADRAEDRAPETPDGTSEAAEPQLYDNWQEAFLGLLAGTAKGVEQEGRPEAFMMGPSGFYYRSLSGGTDDAFWYLGDFDGDGTPELLMPYGLADGNNMTLYDWTDEGVEEYLGELGPCGLHGEDETGATTLLYGPEAGYFYYNAGTTELEVLQEEWNGEGGWVFNDWLEGVGANYRLLPEHGALSREEAAVYPVSYEIYSGLGYFLEHLTVTYDYRTNEPLNDEYFIDGADYVTEEQYRAAEQVFLDAASVRSIDQTGAPQFAQIPADEVEGPLSTVELVDLLGGFDERPEWSDASEALERALHPEQAITALISDPEALLETLKTQYPSERLGEGCWDFALGGADKNNVLVIRYRQSAAEGDCCFVSALSRTDLLDGTANFLRVAQGEQTVLYQEEGFTHVYGLRTVETSLGRRGVLLGFQSEQYPDDVMDGFVTTESPAVLENSVSLRPLRFSAAEALTERLAGGLDAAGSDLGDPVTAGALRGVDNGSWEEALVPFLEHPELLLNGAWFTYEAVWYQPEQISWDAAILGTQPNDGSAELLLRLVHEGPDVDDWILVRLDYRRGAIWAEADGPWQVGTGGVASAGDLDPADAPEYRVLRVESENYGVRYHVGWETGDPAQPYEVLNGWSSYYGEPSLPTQTLVFRSIAAVEQSLHDRDMVIDTAN